MPFLIIIALLAILVVYLKSPQFKGKVGEGTVKSIIGDTIQGEKYVINDITIRDEKGKTSQIDHILINKTGVFVIETKNYSGRIYGDDNKQEWTQVLQYGKVKNNFYNPIKQNATHIYRLKEVTKTELPLYSIVVFTQGNIQYIKSKRVYNLRELKKVIQQPPVKECNTEDMEKLYNQLLEIKEKGLVTKTEHIGNIMQTLQETRSGICPRCGGKLIKRNGIHGAFYGCEGYPTCKFTKKI